MYSYFFIFNNVVFMFQDGGSYFFGSSDLIIKDI